MAELLAPEDRKTLELVQDSVSPEDLGEIAELRSIVPEKPLILLSVTVKLLVDPCTMDSELGLTVMLNVPTLTVTVIV